MYSLWGFALLEINSYLSKKKKKEGWGSDACLNTSQQVSRGTHTVEDIQDATPTDFVICLLDVNL